MFACFFILMGLICTVYIYSTIPTLLRLLSQFIHSPHYIKFCTQWDLLGCSEALCKQAFVCLLLSDDVVGWPRHLSVGEKTAYIVCLQRADTRFWYNVLDERSLKKKSSGFKSGEKSGHSSRKWSSYQSWVAFGWCYGGCSIAGSSVVGSCCVVLLTRVNPLFARQFRKSVPFTLNHPVYF